MRHSVFTITTSILMDNPNIKITSIPFRTLLLERWGVLMTIKLLRKLRVLHKVDLSMMDHYEYIGQEEAFLGAT